MTGALAEAALPAALRCTRCGVAVDGTRHTRTGYTVGYFMLHTGRTEDATLRRRADEAPLVYRRLIEPTELLCCPACFATPAMRRLWEAFGDEEPPAA